MAESLRRSRSAARAPGQRRARVRVPQHGTRRGRQKPRARRPPQAAPRRAKSFAANPSFSRTKVLFPECTPPTTSIIGASPPPPARRASRARPMQKTIRPNPRHPAEAGHEPFMAVPRERQKPRYRHKGADGLSAHATIPAADAAAKAQAARQSPRASSQASPAAISRPPARQAGIQRQAPKRAGEHERHRARGTPPAVSGSAVNRENCRIRSRQHRDPEGAACPRVVYVSSFACGVAASAASEVSQSRSRWMPPVTARRQRHEHGRDGGRGHASRFAMPPRRHEEAFRKAHQGKTRQAHVLTRNGVGPISGRGCARRRCGSRADSSASSPVGPFAFHPHGESRTTSTARSASAASSSVHRARALRLHASIPHVAYPHRVFVDGDHHRIRSGLSEPLDASRHLARRRSRLWGAAGVFHRSLLGCPHPSKERSRVEVSTAARLQHVTRA